MKVQVVVVTSPWRWEQQGPPKRWYHSTTLHGVTAWSEQCSVSLCRQFVTDQCLTAPVERRVLTTFIRRRTDLNARHGQLPGNTLIFGSLQSPSSCAAAHSVLIMTSALHLIKWTCC